MSWVKSWFSQVMHRQKRLTGVNFHRLSPRRPFCSFVACTSWNGLALRYASQSQLNRRICSVQGLTGTILVFSIVSLVSLETKLAVGRVIALTTKTSCTINWPPDVAYE